MTALSHCPFVDDAKVRRFFELRNTFHLFSSKKRSVLDINQALCSETTDFN